ncbi:MAG: HEAT repeat domain-containing protein [Nitrospiraceae bacterium]|nr:MAG: HEAT repeat domain-containing protein [Nitrospiraceae bacterium]
MHKARLESLIRNLNHQDASKRRSAAEALSDGDQRAIYPLIKALRDDNFGVQDAAMRSLMSIRDEATAYMVIPLLREDSFLRNTAIIILREMGSLTIPLLTVLLKDRDDDVRKFAVDLIHDIQCCDYQEKLIELLKDDTNANVRAAVAKTLGMLQNREAVPQLIEALKDEEWVCFSALEALAGLKDERSIGPIVTLLNSASETVRFAAIETLGMISSESAQKPLLEHVSKAEGFERRATIVSLVQIGTIPSTREISDELIDMLKEGDWEEILVAVKGLVMLQEKKAIHYLIDVAGSLDLDDPENEEKLYFLKNAIQSFGCDDFLIDILNDQSAKYRGKVTAIEIIGDLKCVKAVPVLIKLLKSDQRDVRRSSIKSLGQMDSDEAKECLIEAIADNDSHVRKTAAAAIGKIGEMSAFEPLIKMLHNEKFNDIIEEFVNALLNINSTLFLSRLDEFNNKIRETALRYAPTYNPEASC